MNLRYSILGRNREAYTTRKGIVININVLYSSFHDRFGMFLNNDVNVQIHAFLAYLHAVELHEIGHLFNMETGCDDHDSMVNDGQPCAWCEETYIIYKHLLR